MKSIRRLNTNMRITLAHLLLMALEGVFVIAWLLGESSQGGGFLGFSAGRWAVLFANLLAWAVVLLALYKVWTRQTEKLNIWLSDKQNLFWLFFLTAILFAISFPAALGKIPAIRYFTYFGRIQPSLIWLALSSGVILLTLLVVLRQSILRWLRQFFPTDTVVQEQVSLTKPQHFLMMGIAVAYSSLQIISFFQVREAKWLPDSIDYIFPASAYAWNESGLWMHTKPWGAAVLYKIIGTSPVIINLVQTLLSTLAWMALAWVFSLAIHNRWLKAVALALILGFSLAPSIQMWNHIIQSESLSISLMALGLAIWLSLSQKWRWDKFLALIFLFAWWVGTREANVYLGLTIAGILIFVGLFYKRQRFYWALSILLIFFGYLNMQISEAPTIPRWLYPLTNTVLNRILPNEEYLSYFEAEGMPVFPELLTLSGGLAHSGDFAIFNNSAFDEVERWLYKHGKGVYLRFLISHPVYTLTDPWKNIGLLLEPKNLLSYAPSQYKPTQGWLFGALIFPDSLWLVSMLALATLILTLKVKPWRDPRVFWLMLGSLALFFPRFYLVWHGDAAEVGRHAIQASIQLRLTLWLLLLLALDKMVTNDHRI